MAINRLLVLSAASVLIGGGGFAVVSQALASQPSLVAQSSQPTGPREGWKGPRSAEFAERLGLTEAQQTQLRQIHETSRQQMQAIPTAEQKAQMETIRTNAKTKAEGVLTEQQRQQLQQTTPSSSREFRGRGFARISGLTDEQKTQLRQIHESTHQQMDAILTSEQKSRRDTIRQDTKNKMDAVLTDQQRQQLQQLRQQKRQNRQQQS